jgi:DNA repair protein RadC
LEISELSLFPGIGPAKAAQIKAVFELSRRIHSFLPPKRGKVLSSQDLFRMYGSFFKNKKKEIFKVVLLNGKHQIIRDFIISQGSLNSSIVHPREAFYPAIRESAAAVVFMHNHPSGDPSPSPQDLETTHRLVKVGELIGIKVLDHIIVGEGKYVSLNDRGLLKEGIC